MHGRLQLNCQAPISGHSAVMATPTKWNFNEEIFVSLLLLFVFFIVVAFYYFCDFPLLQGIIYVCSHLDALRRYFHAHRVTYLNIAPC